MGSRGKSFSHRPPLSQVLSARRRAQAAGCLKREWIAEWQLRQTLITFHRSA